MKHVQQERQIRTFTKAIKHAPATKRYERVFLDISVTKKPNNGNKVTLTTKKCRIVLEEFSGMKLSNLYDTNNGIIERTWDQ